jgi:hypothetical protein
MRKIINLTILILFVLIISKSHSQTVNIGIYGTNLGTSMDLRIVLTAIGGNYTSTGASGLIFTIKTPYYSSVIFGTDSLYSSVTHYVDQVGTSGDHYRTYQTTTLAMSINSGESVQVLRVNASSPATTRFEIVIADGDGVINVQYYLENYMGTEVTGVVSPQYIDAPMPVELINFVSAVNNNNVQLNWSTSKEINNRGFYIERTIKSDILQWSQIAFLEGKNGNNINLYSFTDKKLETGKFKYRLKQCDYNGNYEYYNLNSDVEVSTPKKFEVSQNYPNPFNPVTNIDFQLPYNSKVTMTLYDMLGREVATIINREYKAGYYIKKFDASNISSGIYFYRLIADSPENKFTITKKLMVIK